MCFRLNTNPSCLSSSSSDLASSSTINGTAPTIVVPFVAPRMGPGVGGNSTGEKHATAPDHSLVGVSTGRNEACVDEQRRNCIWNLDQFQRARIHCVRGHFQHRKNCLAQERARTQTICPGDEDGRQRGSTHPPRLLPCCCCCSSYCTAIYFLFEKMTLREPVREILCRFWAHHFCELKFAGSRRVLATAVDDWSGKPYCVSSWYKLMPTYNIERRPKSRPNELAFAPFIFPKVIERIRRHRSKDRVFRLSPEIISLFCMLIVFSIEHHLKPIHYHRFALSIND